MKRLPLIAYALALAFAAAASGVCADELRLKDGSKVVGTIVGFEDNSFKVQTSYGFALVRRDQIVSITAIAPEKKPAGEKKPEANAAPPTEPPAATPASSPEPAKAPVRTAEKAPSPATKDPNTAPAKPATQQKEVAARQPAKTPLVEVANAAKPPNSAAASAALPAKAATAPVPEPPKPAPEPPVREEVTGNAYANLTYGFRMYKPPDWEVIAGARSMLPGAITAMGTNDENTYLVIGQEPAGKSLAGQMTATEQRLREVMENFRPTAAEKQITVSGVPATERRFRGSVEGREWSGIVVFIPHGGMLFTIFGMTHAETELVQIQENVMSRAIHSLEFTKQ
ncbi:MAG: hypothetical protein ACRD4K_00960 [Candidatus Acidiferrales bacterium]